MGIVERFGVEFISFREMPKCGGDRMLSVNQHITTYDLGIILYLVYGEVYTPNFEG